MIELSENKIQNILRSNYNGHKYQLFNSFIYDWECDYFGMSTSGYSYEIEIKLSITDFKADFKKIDKHKLLRDANIIVKLDKHLHFKRKMPNKFYYCVPKGLIDIKDIPDYAGLLYTNGYSIEIIKDAKFLHKQKFDLTKVLLEKFYYKSEKLDFAIRNYKFNKNTF